MSKYNVGLKTLLLQGLSEPEFYGDLVYKFRKIIWTAKLLRQGYRYHKFYRRHFDIVSKYNVGLKTLLLQGLSEPEFNGDLVYKFRKIIGKNDFPYHFKKIIVRYKKIGYNINVMRQTACLVVNPISNNGRYLTRNTEILEQKKPNS